MEHFRRLIITIAVSIAILAVGTFGYIGFEGWGFFDAFYMTVITLATVGFSEVHTVSDTGRIFTILLILVGVAFTLYVIGSVMQFLVEGRILAVLGRQRLDRRIGRMKRHYIVCGYGRIGRVLSQFLIRKARTVVIIENDEACIPYLDADHVPYLIGDAGNEKTLEKAGIGRAQGLLTALPTDADNVFLTLSARRMNPHLFIVARASRDETKKTLYAAGANKVISPYDLGARRMAHAVLRPTVIHFLELAFTDAGTDIEIEECRVGADSEVVGATLVASGIRQRFNLIVLAVRKPDGTMRFNPSADTRLEAGDTLVLVGENRNLNRLEKLLR